MSLWNLFTNSDAFNTHLQSDHMPEEGFPNENGNAMKNQPIKNCIMKKEKCGGILGRSTGTFTVTNACCAHLAMIRSIEFLNIL